LNQIFIILAVLYYVEACKEFAGPIAATLRLGNTAAFKEKSQQHCFGCLYRLSTTTQNKIYSQLLCGKRDCSRKQFCFVTCL